ncbi:ribonuclease III [Stappia sp. F7233]|uniref:Ribonuclease 3 n=1 Tax=Stappia albiluteola TaxID=2758565 RepID=A0A839ACP1_9HYPH|nr:ribonuclease III [Stappia albiluteola]MBA5776637.1 ribonuclease III [Stappia albiluteola]
MIHRRMERALEERIGHRFVNPALLARALTHASAAEADGTPAKNYQRLEFLGDRVLGLAIAAMLHEAFPDADEGELARRLNQLVKRETCAAVAAELDVGPALRVGEGEAQTGGRKKAAILADVCEALIAAVYLDAGFEAASTFVDRFWRQRMLSFKGNLRDAKTSLQEWAQGKGLEPPVYQVTERGGPDHAPTFTVAVNVHGYAPAIGIGGSKRIAEQNAAEAALVREGVWTEKSGSE